MSDEFTEHDLDTPTEADLDQAYGSRFLGVVDIGTRKIRTKILKVRKEEVKDRDSGRMKTKFVVFLEGIDKPLILNVVNKDALVETLGKPPAGWLNAIVGIFVDPTVGFGGKKTGGVRLRVLGPAVTPKPAAKPVGKPAAKSTTPAAVANEWPEEKGDPGPAVDRDLKDFEPAE